MVYSFQILNNQNQPEVRRYLNEIGVEPAGLEIMAPKMQFCLIKIKKLTATQANIVKQQILSRGGEAAIAYGAVNHSVEFTDVILAGTLAQLKEMLEKLKLQPFGLGELAAGIEKALENLERPAVPLILGSKTFDLNQRPLVMGILNVTPDSFYDGGKFDSLEAALKRAEEMLQEGADIIDIGGSSTRPGAENVSEEEEARRVLPVLEKIHQKFQPIISIDTASSNIAARALGAGAALVNDISALRADPKMVPIIKKFKAGVILMHMQGTPQNMQNNPEYQDVVCEILDFLKERINFAEQSGIGPDKIIIDPGLGFGKKLVHNLEILKNISSFKALGKPVLIGHSRKSFLGQILDATPDERLEGTLAVSALAVAEGASILRVHDVHENVHIIKVIQALKKGAGV